VNAVEQFLDGTNRGDLSAIESAFHPDFEMIVPQHPARGFTGRDQEVKNMRYLLDTHPEGRLEVLRMVEAPPEIWVETHYTATDLEMAAAVIFEIEPSTGTIIRGRYFSDEVDRESPEIDAWMQGLGSTG
jgi:ketosteroid isomerase-like protein